MSNYREIWENIGKTDPRTIITDEDRWLYVRTHLSQGMDPRMDGTMSWRFRSPHGRAPTINECIDALILQSRGVE